MNEYRTCKQCKKKVLKTEGLVVKLSMVHKECWDDFVQGHVENGRKRRVINNKKKCKKTSDLEMTQKVFNKYIRARDTKGDRCKCISCNDIVYYRDKNLHAGHFYSRGARSDLRFNEDNVHAQCASCNMFGEADTGIKFKKQLLIKIGRDRFIALGERIAQDYSKENLKKMRKEYSLRIKELIK